MKKDFPNITIAGVNRKVFSIDLSGGLQEPYSLKLSFVSGNESYDLNTRDPIQVRIGSFFDFTGYAVAFSKRKSVSSGETSELTLVDTSIILDKYWIGLKGKYGGDQPILRKGTGPERRVQPTVNYNVLNPVNKITSDANLNKLVVYETDGDFSDLILVGSYIDPCKDLESDSLTDMCDPCTAEQASNIDCAKSRNFEILDVDYTFSELIEGCKSKNIKIYGNISAPTDYRAQYTGTVRSVLESWCKDFGYGFYWDNGGVNFINLKQGINISNINLEDTSNCKIEEYTISESIQDTKKIVNIAYFGKKGEIKNYQCSTGGGGSSDTTTTQIAQGINLEDLWKGNAPLKRYYASIENLKRVVHASNITENIRNCIVWKYVYGFDGPSTIEAKVYPLMSWDILAVLHGSTSETQVKQGIDSAACRAAYNAYIRSQKEQGIPADELGYYLVIAKQDENKFYEFEKEIISKKFTGKYAIALTGSNEGKQFASEDGMVSNSIPDLNVNHFLVKESDFEIVQDTQTKFKVIKNVAIRTDKVVVLKGNTPSLVCIEKEPSWTPSEDILENAKNVDIIHELPDKIGFERFFEGLGDNYKIFRIASTSNTGGTNYTSIQSDGNIIKYKSSIKLLFKDSKVQYVPYNFAINFPFTQSRRFQVTKTGNNFTPGPIITLIPKLEIVNANSQIRPNEDYVSIEVNHQNITDNNLSRITKGNYSCYVDKGKIYEYGNSIIKNLNTSLPLKKITKTYSILGLPDSNFSFKDGLTSFSLRLDQSGTRTSLSFSNLLQVQVSDNVKKNELNYLTKSQSNVNYINNTFK